jgi:hypothetical protein
MEVEWQLVLHIMMKQEVVQVIRVYEYSSGSWSQLGSDINGEAASDYSGKTLAMSSDGSRVAIGANGNDGAGPYSGHVRIYEYTSGSWVQLGTDLDGETSYDQSGISVSLSSDGNRVAIGAHYNDGTASNAGQVRIYEYSSGSWSQVGVDINGKAESDESGTSVAISGDGSRVVIGAPYDDDVGNIGGHVRVYDIPSVCSCSVANSIPTSAGTYTSECSSTDGTWTYYCDANSNLLLALKLGSTGAVIADDEVSLKIESPTATYFTQGCGSNPACFIDLADGAITFKRSWDVSPTTQPSSGNVGVKFYFTQAKYDAVNTEVANQGQTQLTGMNQLFFYKVTNGSLGSFPTISNITESDVQVIYNGSIPGEDEWALSTKVVNSEFIAEYKVSSFSGGGGGAGGGLAPLPIELIYFQVYSDGTYAQLKWATASEINNRGFEVERSKDDVNWKYLEFMEGTINSTSISNYLLTDKEPMEGINYYRLKQIDVDGKIEYLPIRNINMVLDKNSFVKLYPNPVKDLLNITNAKGKGAIYDSSGRLFSEFILKDDTINMVNVKNLKRGVYHLVLIKERGERVIKRFVK